MADLPPGTTPPPSEPPHSSQTASLKMDPKAAFALADAFKAMATNVEVLTKGLDTMKNSMDSMGRPAKDLTQHTHELVEDLKDSIEAIDDTHEKLKLVASTMKSFSRIAILDKDITNGKAVEFLKKMNEQMEELKKSTTGSSTAGIALKKAIEENEKAMLKLADAGEDASKIKTIMSEIEANARGVTKAVSEVSKELKSMENFNFDRQSHSLGTFAKEAGSIFKNIATGSHLSVSGIGAITKQIMGLRNHAKKAAKEMASDWQRAGKVAAAYGASVGKPVAAADAAKHFKSLKEGGKGIPGLFSRFDKDEKSQLFQHLSGRSGVGGFVDRFALSVAEQRTQPGGPGRGIMGKIAGSAIGAGVTSLVGAGGGSAISGAVSSIGAAAAANPIGAAVIGIGLLAGGAALAAGKVGADMNKKLVEAMGKGGIVGGDNPYQRLQETRAGLMPATSDTNAGMHGMTYEKNMEIMKAIVESGLSAPHMAGFKPGEALTNSKTDFRSGIMRNAYQLGTRIGLDPIESTKLMVKNMTEFHQSISGTEDFFIKVNKATQSAGISTTHYLNLIDGVTGAFSTMNKTLQTTVDTLTALGKSGKYTATDLKDMMDAMTGRKKSTAEQAFIVATQPGVGRAMVSSAAAQTRSSKVELGKQLWQGEKLSDDETVARIDKYLETEQGRQQLHDLAGTKEKAAGIHRQLMHNVDREQALRGGGALGIASTLDNSGGANLGEQWATNVGVIKTGLGSNPWADLLDPKKQARLRRSTFGNKVMEFLGGSDKFFNNYRPIANAIFEHLRDNPDIAEQIGLQTEKGEGGVTKLKAKNVEELARDPKFEEALTRFPEIASAVIQEEEKARNKDSVLSALEAQWSKVDSALATTNRLLDNIKDSTALMAEDKRTAKEKKEEDTRKKSLGWGAKDVENWGNKKEVQDRGAAIAKNMTLSDLNIMYGTRTVSASPAIQVRENSEKIQTAAYNLLKASMGKDVSGPNAEAVKQAQRVLRKGVEEQILSTSEMFDPNKVGNILKWFEGVTKEVGGATPPTPTDSSKKKSGARADLQQPEAPPVPTAPVVDTPKLAANQGTIPLAVSHTQVTLSAQSFPVLDQAALYGKAFGEAALAALTQAQAPVTT